MRSTSTGHRFEHRKRDSTGYSDGHDASGGWSSLASYERRREGNRRAMHQTTVVTAKRPVDNVSAM